MPIGVIGNAHAAAERQRLVRGGQFTIVQMAAAGGLCTVFACRIERCNAAFGACRAVDGCERSRRNDKSFMLWIPFFDLPRRLAMAPQQSRAECLIRHK